MKRTLAILMAALLLTPSMSTAEGKKGVELVSRSEVDVVQKNDKGEKVLTRVDTAKANVVPGDTVIFTITYVNNGDQPATGVTINNPVPQHMVYLDKSAQGSGARIDFSVDKGKTYGAMNILKAKTASGKEKPAAAEDITNVRWVLENPLKPGSSGNVSYRAKVK